MKDVSKNVLLVTNAAADDEILLVKDALVNAAKQGMSIKLSLVHVIPNLPTCYFNIPSMVLLAEQYYEEAKKCLSIAGENLGVAKKDQWLITGKIKSEVIRLASKLDTQFILASSTNIQDLHKVFSVTRHSQPAQVRNINNLAASNF